MMGITRHDQMMLATLQRIAQELKRSNDLKEQELKIKEEKKEGSINGEMRNL